MEPEEKSLKEKNVNVHRIITTSFNVHLNTFMAKFYEKKPSFEVVQTGGLTEIRVSRDSTIFSVYSYILKNFREDLFRASVNWSFPIGSFLHAFDSLVSYFIEAFSYTYDFNDEENTTLYTELIDPLSDFLNEMDQEFGISHFQEKVATLKQDFLSRTEKYELSVRVMTGFNIPVDYVRVDFYKVKPEFVQYIMPLDSMVTDLHGIAKIMLKKGSYKIEIGKYKKNTVLDLDNEKLIELRVFALSKLLRHFLKLHPEKYGIEPQSEIETDKSKRVEMLIREESELNEPQKEQATPQRQETITTGNFYGHRFVVPREVYSNAEYREYLNYAKTMKSVKVIVDEYYKKHKKKHW